jgi:hypothetical protein
MKKIVVFLFIAILITGFYSCKKGTATPPPASFYLINVSPGSQSLNFSIDGAAVNNGLAYNQDSGYYSISPGLHHLQISKTGASTNLIDVNISLTAAQSYSLFTIDSITKITPVTVVDTTVAPISDTAKLRVLNFLLGSPVLNVGVIIAGDTLNKLTYLFRTFNDQGTNSSKSSFQKIVAGTYTLNLIDTTGNKLIKSFPGLTLSPGKIYTVFINGVYTDTLAYPVSRGIIQHN